MNRHWNRNDFSLSVALNPRFGYFSNKFEYVPKREMITTDNDELSYMITIPVCTRVVFTFLDVIFLIIFIVYKPIAAEKNSFNVD